MNIQDIQSYITDLSTPATTVEIVEMLDAADIITLIKLLRRPFQDAKIVDMLEAADIKHSYIILETDSGDEVIVPDTDTYYADDGNCEVEFPHSTPEEAAQEYVDGGSWGDDTQKTQWISVTTYRKGVSAEGEIINFDHQDHKITLEPTEPECHHADGHHWETLDGPYGHGGGVILYEACTRCGLKKTTNTCDYDHSDGEQGLESVGYSADDEHAQAFAKKHILSAIADIFEDLDAVDSYETTDSTIIATIAPDEPERRDFDQACDGIESAVDSALGNPCYLDYSRRESSRLLYIAIDWSSSSGD